jgi:hypothetical protein
VGQEDDPYRYRIRPVSHTSSWRLAMNAALVCHVAAVVAALLTFATYGWSRYVLVYLLAAGVCIGWASWCRSADTEERSEHLEVPVNTPRPGSEKKTFSDFTDDQR